MHYDLLVIGNGPAAHQGALAAAKLHQRVAVVGRCNGNDCLSSGSVAAKTVHEAILHLAGSRQITIDELRSEIARLIQHESADVRDQLDRNGVETLTGEARFLSPHEVEITGPEGKTVIRADRVLVATGSRPLRPVHIPFDGKHVLDADEVLNLDCIPGSMIVVGGGATGIAWATVFAALGARVTVVDGRERLLDGCDQETVDTLLDGARSMGVVFRLGEDVIGVDWLPGETVAVHLESCEQISGETVLFCVGRLGNTGRLNLQAAGIETDERRRLWCNEDHQTWASHIYGAGDVVGFPASAGSVDELREITFEYANVAESVDAEEVLTA